MKMYDLITKMAHLTVDSGMRDQDVTVHLPGMGAAAIEKVVWHDSCNQYHIMLKQKDSK